jgi:hypothetical protein
MLELANVGGRRRKQERPRELLDAALAVFVEKGFAAARADLIAEGFASRIDGRADQVATSAGASSDLLRQALTVWQASLTEGQASGIFKLVLTEVRHFPGLADCWNREVMGPARFRTSSCVASSAESSAPSMSTSQRTR